MDKKTFLETIKKLKKTSKKRNFNQTFDLVINLKQLGVKKSEQTINTFVILPHPKGKKTKICALVDKQLAAKAKEVFDEVVLLDDFPKYKEKIKDLAKSHDFFITQANIMTKVASNFGKILGPLGKMPNPKAGCIVPPTADLKILNEKLQKTVPLQTKNELTIKCSIGKEDMKDEEITENAYIIYDTLLHNLPQEKQNIKSVILKLTMSKPIIIQDKKEIKEKNE